MLIVIGWNVTNKTCCWLAITVANKLSSRSSAHLPPKFYHPMFTRSEVIALTNKHTNTQTTKQTPLKASNALRYATTLGNYFKIISSRMYPRHDVAWPLPETSHRLVDPFPATELTALFGVIRESREFYDRNPSPIRACCIHALESDGFLRFHLRASRRLHRIQCCAPKCTKPRTRTRPSTLWAPNCPQKREKRWSSSGTCHPNCDWGRQSAPNFDTML